MLLREIFDRLIEHDENVILVGNSERVVNRISSPESAREDSICALWDEREISRLESSVVIVAPRELFEAGRDGIACEKPRELLAHLLEIFASLPKNPPVISESAVICSGAFVGENCVVGDGTVIEPNAVLLSNVKVGKNCLIHSGAVLGCDGFGFIREKDSGLIRKIPQIGGVEIGDDVEIGACTTIDCGTIDDTQIGSGTKIDNHVQIGHNVKIGRNCIICSMSGIAGSSVLEDDVTVSVQVGITDHVTIGKGAVLAARTGVTNDVPAGALYSGFPARNHSDAKRALVLSADLPVLYRRVKLLEKEVKALAENN